MLVERPKIDILREQGVGINVRDVPGGYKGIFIRDERAQRRAPSRLTMVEIKRIEAGIATAVQEKRNHVAQLLSGREAYDTFIRGLQPSRKGMLGSLRETLFPEKRLHFWEFHPGHATGMLVTRLLRSHVGKATTGSKAVGWRGKDIFVSKKAEQRKLKLIEEIKKGINADKRLNDALQAYSTNVTAALQGLKSNPTPERLFAYNKALEAAEKEFRGTVAAIQMEFNRELAKRTKKTPLKKRLTNLVFPKKRASAPAAP
jgi:hypothetical protein